jgi:GNAT superfamily N-acetyltransferase
MIIFRPARESDLAAMYFVYYLNEISEAEAASATPPQNVPAMLRHVFETGTMYVAEQDDTILAFAGAITRGAVTFLTDLFVRPRIQSSGLGKTLLSHVLLRDQPVRCTMSSTDPRAQALYTRVGMQPVFPHYNLQWQRRASEQLPTFDTELEVVEGQVGDPALLRWDAQVSGRNRPEDHAFWTTRQQCIPLWFQRRGAPVGYAYVWLDDATPLTTPRWVVGPLGVSAPEYATECVLAATKWVQQRAGEVRVRIDVPGPHPALAPLLERGFYIVYVETFQSSATMPFFDARCYIPSGSDLL